LFKEWKLSYWLDKLNLVKAELKRLREENERLKKEKNNENI